MRSNRQLSPHSDDFDMVSDLTMPQQAAEEHHRKEEQFRLITGAVPALIAYLDNEYRLCFANDSYGRWFGVQPDEIVGLHLQAVIGDDAWHEIHPYIDRALTGEQLSYEKKIRYKSSPDRWINASYTPDRDADGGVRGIVALVNDISRQKQAEEETLRSEERYLSLLNTTPAILYRYSDRRGGIYYSPRVSQYLGYTPEYLLANPLLWRNSIHHDDLHRVDRALVDLAQNGVFDLEYRIRTRGGDWRWFHDRSISHLLEDGELVVDGIAEDITRRKLAEDELQEERRLLANRVAERTAELTIANELLVKEGVERKRTEEKLRTERSILTGVMEGTDVLLSFLDCDFNYVSVNRAYADTYRRRPEELIGKNRFALYPHPEIEAICRQVLERGEPVFFKDKPILFCDQPERGTTYWDWSLVPYKDETGTVTGLVSSAWETTLFRRAEERVKSSEALLRSVAEGTTDAIFVKDRAGRFEFANPVTLQLFGKSAEELLGRSSAESFPDPFMGRAMEANDERIMSSGRAEMVEETLATPQGLRYFLTTKSPRYDSGNTVTGLIGIARDITDRKRVEEALADQKHHDRLNMELVLAGARERRRISSILHDQIGQNLLLQKMKLRMLEESMALAPEKTMLAEIRELLDETITGVRSLTVQLCPPILETLGLTAALEWLVKKIRMDFALQVKFTDDGSPKPLDQERREVLYQAIRELLVNVAKHAETDRAGLAISREGERLVVTVTDQGRGCTPSVKGEGYGLHFIRRNMEHFGGSMALSSRLGHGTVVTLHFPLTSEKLPGL